jgi:Na+-translocating ferredoxin:NAD+ oxidoreductase RnfE subunit
MTVLSAVLSVCRRVSGETQRTPAKIMILASMVVYVFRLTADPSANAETSTLKGYFARKVGTYFNL